MDTELCISENQVICEVMNPLIAPTLMSNAYILHMCDSVWSARDNMPFTVKSAEYHG